MKTKHDINTVTLFFVTEFRDLLNEWFCDHSVGHCYCKESRKLMEIIEQCDATTKAKIELIISGHVYVEQNEPWDEGE